MMRSPADARQNPQDNPIVEALHPFRAAIVGVVAFSGLVNILMLTGPLFMLQVYDRVIPSRSMPTLVAFVILMVVLFVFSGALDFIRSRVLHRIGQYLDEKFSKHALKLVLSDQLRSGSRAMGTLPMRDLEQVRLFAASPGPAALLDVPWTPLYLVVVFLFHPLLGWLTVCGATFLLTLAVLNERAIKRPIHKVAVQSGVRMSWIEAGRRNAEIIQALGMANGYMRSFEQLHSRYLQENQRAGDYGISYSTITKTFRFILQSLVLALGAVLTVRQEITPGVMIAASIISSRALAPIEQIIGQWRNFVTSRQSYIRLANVLKTSVQNPDHTALPPLRHQLSVTDLAVAPPGSAKAALTGVTFDLKAGDGLAVIGPSASGKSTLARALVGVWPAARGVVRLDGAAMDQWDASALGGQVGYLPQDVELFQGTVAQNIARFSEAGSDAVISAAMAAGAHQMILGLDKGYDTQIGEAGSILSAGQRQRIALARALFGSPFLIVLDEPNSNIDAQGEHALTEAIKACRMRGAIVVIIAHRPSALASVDLVLVLDRGHVRAFGPKDEVLKKTLVTATPPDGDSETSFEKMVDYP